MTKKQLESIPQKTGIYKFFDKNNDILYIGKALNLKSRVSSYFRDTHHDRPHIIKMISLIDRIETIVTENEVESLILETALIKKYKPKFNILSKDDKSFSWIYISTYEKFPNVKIVKSIKRNEFKKGKLFGPYPKGKTIKRVFDYIRKLYPFCTCKSPKEPCLYYHLNLCPGPYHNKISEVEYKKNIDNIIKFLSGGKRNILSDLRKEMKYYAKSRNFEKAAVLRDKINDLEYLSQKITISPFESEDEYLYSRYEKIRNSLITLSKQLSTDRLKRIECFDISNIQGESAYGAMSVAIDGRLVTDQYRAFKIRGVVKADDPKMLSEMISRRFKNLSQENKPDLILIDGGVVQLSILRNFVPKDIKLVGISKGKRLKRMGKKQKDEFWILEGNKFKNIVVKFPFLLLELRDEAHRFALKHHRKSRRKDLKSSVLDCIQGVGNKRKTSLIKHFKGIDGIKKAPESELNKVVRNKQVAKHIYEFFHQGS